MIHSRALLPASPDFITDIPTLNDNRSNLLPEYSLERCQKNSWPRYAELGPNSCCTARPRDLESVYRPLRSEGWYPHYEFFCHAGQKTFSKILALVDYEEGEMRCPHCGSTHVGQRWSTFTAITSKKSA